MNKFLLTILILIQSKTLYACSVCFYGDADDPYAKAVRTGMLSLLGFLGVVMVFLVKFIINFNRRSKSLQDK